MDNRFPLRAEELAHLDATLSRARSSAPKWSAVCDQLTRCAGAVGVVLVPVGASHLDATLTSSLSLVPALEAYRSEGWFRFDPRQDLTDLIVTQGHAHDTDIYAIKTLEALPFYSDLLSRHGLGGFCGVHFSVDGRDWYAAIQFAKGRYAARPGFVDAIPRIRDGLTQAASKMMGEADQTWGALVRAAECLGTLLVPMDRDGKICAELPSQLAQSDVDQDLLDEAEAIAATLSPDLVRWIKSGVDVPPPPRIYTSIHEQSFACSLQFMPEVMNFFALRAVGHLRISKVQGKVNEAVLFAEKAGLTPAECKVVQGLCEGQVVKVIAQKQGLKEGTVRQQLKSVFRKTHTSSQHELVAAVFRDARFLSL